MLSILSIPTRSVDRSSEISKTKKFIFFFIKLTFVAALFYLCYLNLWVGGLSVLLTTLFYTRRHILFFFYVLSMDFSLDKEINDDLSDM